MPALENCEPKRVFHYFEEICKIPHGSGNTKQISDYLVKFAEDHGFKYVQDEMNNVIIYKPGTAGYEKSPTVIIQGHMDMVCEKRPDVNHDFTEDGLNISVKDGYVTANGTTLGGDDGIAVAYSLALLDSTDIPHPPLEILLTVDEEIGLLGAVGLDCSVLEGRRFINLDSEAEGSLWISCAGGLSGVSHIPVQRVEGEGDKVQIKICGLMGGHSGAEIDKNRANANKLMGRFFYGLKKKADYAIVSLAGGQKDNAITRECTAQVLTNASAEVKAYAKELQAQIREEYAGTDENISIEVTEEGTVCTQVLHPTSQEKVLFYLQNVPFGVQKMSGTIPGLVETSLNFATLHMEPEEEVKAGFSLRSSSSTAKQALKEKLCNMIAESEGEYEANGEYPSWEYKENSELREQVVRTYKEVLGKEPKVLSIHAGLECGILSQKIEGLDCVSFGPNIDDMHTTKEKLSISSTQRIWELLKKLMQMDA